MELRNARGTKDYLPQQMITINRIIQTLQSIFERYGYNPLSTPAIERLEVLSAKYAGGSEILKETFKLTDQGGRELGLRYDLTVPFARVVGQNPQLKLPFKRYQIEKVYRDGPIKAGRYREFWQCDVDVVGAKTVAAESELLAIAERFFNSIGIDARLEINNRKIMNSILDTFDVQDKVPVILIIDKMEKQPKQALVKEMLDNNIQNAEEIYDTFAQMRTQTNEERLTTCTALAQTDEGKEGLAQISQVLEQNNAYGLKKVVFNPTLARGLGYYTGTVFEGFANNNAITSSICGGGRFDDMIGNFLENNQPYPAIGISFGLSTIYDIIAQQSDQVNTVTQVFVISYNQDAYAQQIAEQLRDNNINVEIDLAGRNMRKNMEYVNALTIPFAIIVGEDEVKANMITVKDMNNGNQQTVSIDDFISLILGRNL